MEQLRIGFEMALKNKLAQKTNSLQSEETTLMRCFRYFDIDADGYVSMPEWFKAIEKIGVVVPTIEDLKQLFIMYDTAKAGRINYKDFSEQLFRHKQTKSPAKLAEEAEDNARVEEILFALRQKLATRGVRGLIGLGRQFKIMDTNNARTLVYVDFRKVLNDCKLGLSDGDIRAIFSSFDINGSGSIDYEEFLRIVRGKMSKFREDLVRSVFDMLDPEGRGEVGIETVKAAYSPAGHPEAQAGRRTEDETMFEFLESFDEHHTYLTEPFREDRVSLQEFEDYFSHVSACIEDDAYFESLIKNTWRIPETGKREEQPKPGYYEEREELKAPPVSKPEPPVQYRSPGKRGTANMSSIDNTLQLSSKMYNQMRSGKKEPTKPVSIDNVLVAIRKKLASRGIRAIIGLARQLKVCDDQNSGEIASRDFVRVLKDYHMDLDEPTLSALVSAFGSDRAGRISYEDFIQAVHGRANESRQKIVAAIFKAIDRESVGSVDINEVKEAYNARNHPDVKAGKMSEDEALGEFIETLETHWNLFGAHKNHKISFKEFQSYYNCISICIEDDKAFEKMMTSVWRLPTEEAKTPAQKTMYSVGKGRPLTVTQAAPFGTSDAPVDYTPWKKPAVYKKTEAAGIAAGYPSGPKYEKPATAYEQQAETREGNAGRVLENIRQALVSRGSRGIFSLYRAFKIGTEGAGTVSLPEFKKVLKEYRLKINDQDCEDLFRAFDSSNAGTINYDDVLRSLAGEMSQSRKNLVTKVFKSLDKQGEGSLAADQLKELYTASRHPDVLIRRRTEDDVMTEFLDTFEDYCYFVRPRSKGKLTLEDFHEYYNIVSASIEDDKLFDMMLNNVWNVSMVSYGKGWGSKYQIGY